MADEREPARSVEGARDPEMAGLSPICRRAFLGRIAKAAIGTGVVAGAATLSGCLGLYGYVDFGYGDYGDHGGYGDYYNYGDYGNYANYGDYANYADYANYY
ncbi:MAG TPA: hypothetical protein PLD23_09325 [Armatimonadota bacterium]|nr:hypothetical protein [Armatimonadota bacterium]HQK93694.1 hypothetical protein [Armatimonadota bacterium]